MALGSDFRRLWVAYGVSEIGTGIGFGALPLVAVLVLDVPEFQVSLLAALSGVAAAVLALPLGPWIEHRRKRPVMIGADLVRFVVVVSVPVAMLAGVVSYGQLCVVAVVQSAGTIAFSAASGAHLKALVGVADRATANGRFEATFWTAYSAGPAVGGALTSWFGVAWTITADAVSFLLSAVGVRSLRTPEPSPPVRETARPDITAGWRHIAGHRGLRALFVNSQVFGGSMMAASPLLTVLMLRDLGFAPWQYGIAWGVPCLGGVLGALLAGRLTSRYGQRSVLLVSGVGRAVWLWALAFMPAGVAGLVLITTVEFLALFGSGVFNPAFATYRMTETADGFLSRVIACWQITSRTVQPVCIALGGLLAAVTSLRTALLVCGLGVAPSSVLLPWRTSAEVPAR
ncbi:MFS transporter [Paractinoplanes abujensis]|uniref:MFS family permease n=1 Tax=Paractinoplanes abujensis TaxID=882441 RepID=A0A7W7CNA9_9ACTN|nr:MFS transporter [Actinoplanes abujensis]MBB4691429.1 MFS family permease [Actinoplanes abujensis]GID17157.1 MFS transporter [Actinoplanes abujensis]